VDPRLHLALLERSFGSDLVDEVRDLAADERSLRYVDLLAEEVPADTDEARWADGDDLRDAVPEGDDDTIRTLAGIDAHPQLRLVYFPDSAVDDLSPLTALGVLELLRLGVTTAADLTPLLSCDRLRRVNIDCAGLLGAPAYQVLETLAARGVQVDNLLPLAEAAAAPFADPTLKLAVLDELGRSVELPRMYSFDGYEFDDDNLARLMTVEIPQEQLDSIEKLSWLGGGHAIVHMVWPQWDGESDEFTIRSLTGIEALRNLTKLAVSPLEALPTEQISALRARGVTVTEWPG
jgi:hypothetical protein